MIRLSTISSALVRRIKRIVQHLFPGTERNSRTDTPPGPSLFIVQKLHDFQEVLSCNHEILKLIGELEDQLAGDRLFGLDYVQDITDRISMKALHLIKGLNHLAGGSSGVLYAQLERISAELQHEIKKSPSPRTQEIVVPYRTISKSMVDDVGGKNATLGDLKNSLGMNVPEGFAITTHAFDAVMRENGIEDKVRRTLSVLDRNDWQGIESTSKKLQTMLLNGTVPTALLQAIDHAYNDLERATKPNTRVAVRSSAIHEDSTLSFAGQYESVLNVSRENIPRAYKQVLASLYHPSALWYLAHKGLSGYELKMGVGCMAMIPASAAGIVYTRDPNNPGNDTVFISAVAGLGKSAVDGTATPDIYVVDRSSGLPVHTRIAPKNSMLVPDPNGGIRNVPLMRDTQGPCLDGLHLRLITDAAVTIERAYVLPQDIEFCIDEQGRLFILQARPLRFSVRSLRERKKIAGCEVISERGSTVCPGIGIGRAFIVTEETGIGSIPAGSVLVARHSSPRLVQFMDSVSAIVTDTGGIAGHLATIAREFNIPAITDAVDATSAIRQGETITVDATSAYIYRGAVRELNAVEKPKPAIMKYTPVYDILRRAASSIIPLNLTNPHSAQFTPAACATIHDITRYCHETAIAAMFATGEAVNSSAPVVKAGMRLPVDLSVLDIGNGLRGELRHGKLYQDNIASAPFAAFMKGLTNPGIRWWEPRRIDLRGFLSVLASSATRIQDHEKPLGDRSYAVISPEYMNFNARVGYHFSTIDAYCDAVKDNNYITFFFQGGASEDSRRLRRVKFLSGVLGALGFVPETRGDRVMAYLRKDDKAETEQKLDMLGRLTLCSLHLDMLMTSDASVDWFVRAFLEGNYNFELH